MTSIQSIAAHLPKFRMARSCIAEQLQWFDPALKGQAKGSRTLANWDEDAITLAVAAARQCLLGTEQPIDNLIFASTTAPFLDRSNAALISEALSLKPGTVAFDSSGSQRAATSALFNTLKAGANSTTLITAADRRGALVGSANEMRYGDAASAIVIGPGDGLARYLGGVSIAEDFIDHYRSAERPTDYNLEDRWVRDVGVTRLIPRAIDLALENVGRQRNAIDRLILPLPAHHAKATVKVLGLTPEVLVDNLYTEVGDTGVGHSLLMLSQELETAKAGEILCLVGFGQGCDVMVFEVSGENSKHQSIVAQLEKTEILKDYLKLPAFSRQLNLASGIRAEADKRTSISAYYRHHRTINSMIGSHCEACQTPHFPPARVCVNCHVIDEMKDYPFANRRASIKSFTEDWQTATPSPPMCYANVEFEGGGNAFLELSDVTPGSIRVGSELSMQFRIKDYDDIRGFRRYFWKPVPVSSTKSDKNA